MPESDIFVDRHIGPRASEVATMLGVVGYESLSALIDAAVPQSIRLTEELNLPAALTEVEALAELRRIADKNVVKTQMIGQGYYSTITPAVIRRGVLESPAWYTAYTPYQPEISQGRLEALLNFQTVVTDLTGLEVAGASLLDEATAVAEAVALMVRGGTKRGAPQGIVLVDVDVFAQTRSVVAGRASAAGLNVYFTSLADGVGSAKDRLVADGAIDADEPIRGIVVQQAGASGQVADWRGVIAEAKALGALVTVATDLLALTLLESPGELGADIAIGSTQRFGVPLFYGGPHAAFLSVRSGLARSMPGRLVGVSADADGAQAYRLALQTREQHIRREKATSNICTAQALLAITASMYAVYHGPEGLRGIAQRVHGLALSLAAELRDVGLVPTYNSFFDTVRVSVPGAAAALRFAAADAGINIWIVDADTIQVSVDEATTPGIIATLVEVLAGAADAAGAAGSVGVTATGDAAGAESAKNAPKFQLAAGLLRETDFLTHPVFNTHHSETSMMRYLRKLSDKDLALDRTMIPLGSCTMKLNAAAEMEPISWPEFAGIHPYVPADQALGYAELIGTLQDWLAEVTGYAAVSVQPNAGSQGEFAGLLAIREFHVKQGQPERDLCLIPASAHGTNAASAALAGMRVAVVATAADGTIDLADLDAKLSEHGPRLAAIMITYPSTHGVYEEEVRTVCDRVHEHGGQVYIDGANLNALVGLAKPGQFGGDVSHLNLHKTFAIPHGGGGPGVGPIGVAKHLVEFLPGDPLHSSFGELTEANSSHFGAPVPVSAAEFGSAGVLPISYAYVAMMGPDGLKRASELAVLNANYVAHQVQAAFPILYTGDQGLVAHECILDLRPLTATTGVTAEDVAKRLMDYGFHAPTLSFPVPGTLMVEPTESENLAELDRFIAALIAIRAEIAEVEAGTWAVADSPLRGAPHTATSVTADTWDKPYSRTVAAYPVASLREDKYWPPVRRIDGAAGDRNLVCSCPPIESFEEVNS